MILALPYLGGKSIRANSGLGAWIVSVLPAAHQGQTYVEPFAGMLGVLRQRKPAGTEIASDADGRIIAFWRELQDNTNAFAERVGSTLWHRGEYEEAVSVLQGAASEAGNPADTALAVAVVLAQSMHHSLGARRSDWRVAWQPSRASARMHLFPPALLNAAERIRRVQFETRSAEEILQRIALVGSSVVYCDPPYRSADASHRYGGKPLNIGEISEALHAQNGDVAISGFGEEWDHLGWVKNEFDKDVVVPPRHDYEGVHYQRTEMLWTNYQPAPRLEQGAMFE